MDDAELRAQLESEHVAAFGWALVCCRGDRESAEEVLHEVYVSVLDGRARFSARSSFRTWLFGVIRIAAASKRRHEWLRALRLERYARRGDVPTSHDVADSVERASRVERLRRALAMLPARQREVLHLVFQDELTVEAAAGVMGVSVGSARTHYARGKTRLAKLLGASDDL